MRRVVLAESHPVARWGYRHLLEAEFGPVEFVEAASLQALLSALGEKHCDLLLLDLTLPGQPGAAMLRELRNRTSAPILVVSSYPEDVYAGAVLRAGAAGFVSKASPAEILLQAVRQVLSGRRYISATVAEQMLNKFVSMPGPLHEQLSPRERQVFHSLAVGQSITSIASEMSLSVKTVSTYRARILEKMSMRSNADMTAYFLRMGLDRPLASDLPVPPAEGDSEPSDSSS